MDNNTGYDRFMQLTIFVNSDDQELHQLYTKHISRHNQNIINDPTFANAGFDLIYPDFENSAKDASNRGLKVDFRVQCSAGIIYLGKYMRNDIQIINYSTGYYMYPRSSLSKTSWRLANSTGIIDSGYRGNIIGMFDYQSGENWTKVEKYDRLVQICAPNLVPIFVNLVTNVEQLGPATFRNNGGFGSTGK